MRSTATTSVKGPWMFANLVSLGLSALPVRAAGPKKVDFAHDILPLLKPRRPQLPPARAGHDHPIDRIVDAYHVQNKVTPPAALDDVAFIRRLYLDVLGLLPAPEELNAFLQDTAADKRTGLIRRVLA